MSWQAPPDSPRDTPPRKRMRKGTQSCFDCHRRKVKCTFPPGLSKCVGCFERGAECVEQSQGNPLEVIKRRKNLRERVARLEHFMSAIVGLQSNTEGLGSCDGFRLEDLLSLTKPGTSGSSNQAVASKVTPPTHGNTSTSNSESFLFEIERRNSLPSGAPFGFTVTPPAAPALMVVSNLTVSKHEATRKALLAMLPETADLMVAMRQEKPLSTSLQQAQLPPEVFATQVIEFGSPVEVATLLVRCAVQLDQISLKRALSAADRLIVGEKTYMSTLTGLEFSLLLAHAYSNTGQMHKAWMVLRRGLLGAQLIGIHKCRRNLFQETIWWGLLLSDRFYSLMLGLPYGIADNLCNLLYDGHEAPENQLLVMSRTFMVDLSRMICNVIDLIQGARDLTISSLLHIDHQLSELSENMPAEFWNIGTGVMDSPERFGQITGQLSYHYTKVVLHTHFLFKSSYSSGFEHSDNICLHSIREFLKLYHLTRYAGREMFNQSKTLDYAGYTTSVLLAMRLLGHGFAGSTACESQQEEADWKLVDCSIDILLQHGIQQEWYHALRKLSLLRSSVPDDVGTTVIIPYFGTVTIGRTQKVPPSTASHTMSSSWPTLSDFVGESPIPPIPTPWLESPTEPFATFASNIL